MITRLCSASKELAPARLKIADVQGEYNSWSGAKYRCFNPKCKAFKYYGGRGITMCPQWRDSFWTFFAHVGRKPSPKHSIDRYPDFNGNYEPGNVRWATAKEQGGNTRMSVDWVKWGRKRRREAAKNGIARWQWAGDRVSKS